MPAEPQHKCASATGVSAKPSSTSSASTASFFISDVIIAEKANLQSRLAPHASRPTHRVAFHAPCTLQHGLKKKGAVEELLTELGFNLTPVADAHLCCGSAGTYSILQPELSNKLRDNKIAALTEGAPQAILTANIGCQSQLQNATTLPVRHWIEALDDLIGCS